MGKSSDVGRKKSEDKTSMVYDTDSVLYSGIAGTDVCYHVFELSGYLSCKIGSNNRKQDNY